MLEVIVVLAVLAVLVSVAVPRLFFPEKWELEAAAQKMASNMRFMRQEAIAKTTQCTIDFYIYKSCYLLRLPGESNCIELPQGVKFEGDTTFSGSPPSVHFSSLGSPSSGGTVILITEDEQEKRYIIMVPVTGRVRISKEPPSHW